MEEQQQPQQQTRQTPDQSSEAPAAVQAPQTHLSAQEAQIPQQRQVVQPEQTKQAEQTKQTQQVRQESFADLIQGKYQKEFQAAVKTLLTNQAREQSRYYAYRQLQQQADRLQQQYPDFTLSGALEDPRFAALIRAGVTLADAYAVVHRQRLQQARQTQNRPVENGLGHAGAAAVYQPDPRSLTPEQRRQLKRRANRGERIVW